MFAGKLVLSLGLAGLGVFSALVLAVPESGPGPAPARAAGRVPPIPGAPAPAAKATDWCLILNDGKTLRPLFADGALGSALAEKGSETWPAPDGRWAASFADAGPDGQPLRAKGSARPLVVAAAGKAGRPELRDDSTAWKNDFAWSPDGKQLAYTRAESRLVVVEWDVDTGKSRVVDAPKQNVRMPAYTHDGRLAMAVETKREGKAAFFNLVVEERDRSFTRLLENLPLQGFAFSPDGKHLAYTAAHLDVALTIRELATGKERRIAMNDLEPGWHVCFVRPVWRPDSQGLACTLAFLGGVGLGPNGERPAIPGEGHVVLVPLAGKPKAVDVGGAWPHRWADAAPLRK